MILQTFFILTIGIAALVKTSDWFIENIAKIAKILGISEFIIGLTIVAIGTSLPELASSIAATLIKDTDLIIGNIIGSNIANTALILGSISLVYMLTIDKEVFEREGIFLLLITILTYIMSFNGSIAWYEALIFLFLFLSYTLYLYEYEKLRPFQKEGILYHYLHFTRFVTLDTLENVKKGLSYKTYRKIFSKKNGTTIKQLFPSTIKSIGSLAIIIISANIVATSASSIAQHYHIASGLIGATLLAIGTSLPELTIGILAAKKGKGDFLIGTIMGSNIFNILIILGISGLITPLIITPLAISYTIPILILITAMFLWFIRMSGILRRIEGITLLLIYLLFLLGLFFWI